MNRTLILPVMTAIVAVGAPASAVGKTSGSRSRKAKISAHARHTTKAARVRHTTKAARVRHTTKAARVRHTAKAPGASRDPVTTAEAIAEGYWGAIPCTGQITIFASALLPARLESSTDGLVTFNSSLAVCNLSWLPGWRSARATSLTADLGISPRPL